MDNFSRLHRVLDTGDLELRFHDNRSIKAHSQKLKIASLDGVLHNLIEDVVDDQITGNKRKRTGDSETAADLAGLRVRRQNPCHHADGMDCTDCGSTRRHAMHYACTS